MKRIILVGAFALLAACGSTNSDASIGAAADQTSAPESAAPNTASDDTITIDNFGDMPPKCIELFTSFLKQIEPAADKIDWEKATLADFEAFSGRFKAETDAFNSQTTAAGCDKYNLDPSDKKIFDQVVAVAAAEAPGTVGFLRFMTALGDTSTSGNGSVPTDCAGTIAAIEPYLATGETMKDLTMAELTQLGELMTAVNTNCTAEEAAAFFGRDDVQAYIAG